jgi:hypothetical protein
MDSDLKRALKGELPTHLTPDSGLAALKAALLKGNSEKNRVRSALVETGLTNLTLADCGIVVESLPVTSCIDGVISPDESKPIYGRCFPFWSDLEEEIILRNNEAMNHSILQSDLAELAILHLGLTRGKEDNAESLAKLKSTVKNYVSKWASNDERHWLRASNKGKRRNNTEKNTAMRFLLDCAASVQKPER